MTLFWAMNFLIFPQKHMQEKEKKINVMTQNKKICTEKELIHRAKRPCR